MEQHSHICVLKGIWEGRVEEAWGQGCHIATPRGRHSLVVNVQVPLEQCVAAETDRW